MRIKSKGLKKTILGVCLHAVGIGFFALKNYFDDGLDSFFVFLGGGFIVVGFSLLALGTIQRARENFSNDKDTSNDM